MPIIIGDSIHGSSISSVGGRTVIVSGGKVIVDGQVVSEGEPLPEIDETFDGVSRIEIDGMNVSLLPGDTLRVKGTGEARKIGSTLRLSLIEAEVTVPDIDSLYIKVDSGRVSGAIRENQNLDVKANSGTVNLAFQSSKPVTVNAKANSGDITIHIN